MRPAAFIYCRISDDKTGARLGVQRQDEDCRALEADKGFDVLRVFQDNDISAYSGKVRPEYAAMLKRVAAGEVDAVICWHPDRLHRRPVELEAYIDACRACEEATAGKWTDGTRPFGWNLVDGVPELHPQESAAFADAFARVIRGDSLGSIIRDMNEQGIKASRGNKWGCAQLTQALQRPRNAGLTDLHAEILSASTFPPIVTENVWRGVCDILADPSRRRSQSNKAVHLLAGIAQCHCGEYVRSAFVRGRHGEIQRIYRCAVRGPGHVSKRIEFVDKVVNTVIVGVRAAQQAEKSSRKAGPSPEAERLRLEAAALRKRQDGAGLQAALGNIPMSQLGTINNHIEKEPAAVTAEMARIEREAARQPPTDEVPVVSMDSSEARGWLGMHIDDRRNYDRNTCNVVLLPHGRGSTKVFNPDTVQLVVKAPGEAPGPMTPPGCRLVDEVEADATPIDSPS